MNTPGLTDSAAQRPTDGAAKRQSPHKRLGKHTSVASRNFPEANKTGWLFRKAQQGNKQMNREPVITAHNDCRHNDTCRSDQNHSSKGSFWLEASLT